LSTSNSTDDRGFLVLVAQALTGKVSGTTVGELDDDGRLDVTGSFKSSIDGAKIDSKLDVRAPQMILISSFPLTPSSESPTQQCPQHTYIVLALDSE
jgi:hypothetical protein